MRRLASIACLASFLVAMTLTATASAQDAASWSLAELGVSGTVPEGWVRLSEAERGTTKLVLFHDEWGQAFTIATGPAPSKSGREGVTAMAKGFSKGYLKAVPGDIVAGRDVTVHGRPARELLFHQTLGGEPATSIAWVLVHRGHTLFVTSLIPGDHRDDDADARAFTNGLSLAD